MEVPNAFIGQREQPKPEDVAAVLGSTAALWEAIIHWLAEEQQVSEQEWKSLSPKYGWTLRIKANHRTIVYLGPCRGCFRASFILADRAVASALQADLPKAVIQAIKEAPHYAEGTGVAFNVRHAGDLAPLRQLIQIKLAN